MKATTVGLMIVVFVLSALPCHAQFAAILCSIDSILTDSCGGGDPLSDGHIAQIFWDHDANGPDEQDPQPQVGNCAACCNYNSFSLNGEEMVGIPGTFCGGPAFVMNWEMPHPSIYYVRVLACDNGIRWTSNTFTIPNGISEHFVTDWTCGSCLINDLPGQVTGLIASRNFDDRISLEWSDEPYESGYEIWRSAVGHVRHYELLATSAPEVAAFNDFTAAPGRDYFYRVRALSAVFGPSAFSDEVRGLRTIVEPIAFGEIIVTTNLSGVMSAEPVDLDEDGDMDVVAAGMFADKVCWYENNGSWGFTEHVLLSRWPGARAVAVGDIDSDGDLDIAAVSRFENSLVWFEKVEWGYWMQPISSSVMGASDVILQNINQGGGREIVTAAATGGDISVWHYQGDAGFTRQIFATNLQGLRSLAAKWIFPSTNGRVVTAAAAETGAIVQWRSFNGYQQQIIGYAPGLVACGTTHINAEVDSVNDLYYCTNQGVLGWWERGADQPHIISSIIESPRDVTSADMNNDSRDDLLLASGSEISWWRNTQNRFYRNVIADNMPLASMVRAVDADFDGDMDVLAAGDNEIRFYLSTLNDAHNNASLAKPTPQDDDDHGRAFSLPSNFELFANYPNPFNPNTTIRFALPEASDVRLVVFDVTGREVAVLARGSFEACHHTTTLNATALSSGVYFYRLEAGSFVETRKMILMK